MAAESGIQRMLMFKIIIREPALTWAAGIGNTEVVKVLLKMVLM